MARWKKRTEASGEYLCAGCPNSQLVELLGDITNSDELIARQAGSIAVSMLSREGCGGATVERQQYRSGKYGKSKLRRVTSCGNPNNQLALNVLTASEEFLLKYDIL